MFVTLAAIHSLMQSGVHLFFHVVTSPLLFYSGFAQAMLVLQFIDDLCMWLSVLFDFARPADHVQLVMPNHAK